MTALIASENPIFVGLAIIIITLDATLVVALRFVEGLGVSVSIGSAAAADGFEGGDV